MTIEAMRRMEFGQIVDYCVEWLNLHAPRNEKQEANVTKRKATQADWDAFMG